MHLQAYRPQQSTVYYNSPEKQQSISFRKGGDNQGCCVQGYKNHNCNTKEGCTYQGQNNQGLHFTGIAINSRDVFFKDRFMLAPISTPCLVNKTVLKKERNFKGFLHCSGSGIGVLLAAGSIIGLPFGSVKLQYRNMG